MDALFSPKSIAVIGASPNKHRASYSILKNLIENYKGKIYPVNPKYEEIEGLKCYPSISKVPNRVDVAVVVVNASKSNDIIRECMEKGVKYVVVITSGYREIGGEGVKREHELVNLLRHYRKTRIVGPNCLGVLNTHKGLNLLFLSSEKLESFVEGNISLIFQSGALGGALIDRLMYEGIGIGKFVSYGNGVDLNENDFLEYFIKDSATKVIGMYLEGIRDGRRLYELFKKSKKPIVVVKGGKTRKGSASALTHTGSMAGSYDIFKGMVSQTGHVVAEDFRSFENYLKMFSSYDSMETNKVMVFTNGGGFGVLLADALSSSKVLELYNLTNEEKRMLKEVLPSYANIENPLDLIGDANSERYKNTLRIFRKNSDIGAYIISVLVQTFSMDDGIIEVIANFKKITNKPVVVVSEGGLSSEVLKKSLERLGVVCYSSVGDAVSSLERLYEYSN